MSASVTDLLLASSDAGHDLRKVAMTRFVATAFSHQLRLCGWAKGGDFPNRGGNSRPPRERKIDIASVKELCEPWEKYLLSLYEGKRDQDTSGIRFEFVAWTDGSYFSLLHLILVS